MPLVSSLSVGSLLIYAKGTSVASRWSRSFIRYEIKQGKEVSIAHCARRLREVLPGTELQTILTQDVTLIPVPGHAPLLAGALSVSELVCRAMFREGIGQNSLALLERVETVARSSSSTSAEDRPKPADHYRTIRFQPVLEVEPTRIVLVDDVVTRGSTLIAAASRIIDHFPNVEVKAFALARVEDVELTEKKGILAPVVEAISYNEGTGLLARRR